MDLLGENPLFDTFDGNWKIYSRNDAYPPHFICEGATVQNSLITVGCYIEGEVKNSLISQNVKIGKNSVVEDSIIMSDTIIEDGAVVKYSIIDEGAVIKKNSVVGLDKSLTKKISVIASNVTINENVTIEPGQIIEKDMN